MSEDSNTQKSVEETPSTQGDSNISTQGDSSSLPPPASTVPSTPPASTVLGAGAPSSDALKSTLLSTQTPTSVKLTPEKEKTKEEDAPAPEAAEDDWSGPRIPQRFNDVEKSLLTTGFRAFIKKKLPDVITLEDAIVVFRGCQFVFCAEDMRQLNKEMNGGKPTIDEETFFKVISKVHCATEEEIQACFDVVELEQDNKDLVDVPRLRTLLMSDGEKLDIDEWELFNLEIIPPPPPEDPRKKKKRRIVVKKKLRPGEVEKPPPPPKVPESYFRNIMPQLVVEIKMPEWMEAKLAKKNKKKGKTKKTKKR